MVTAIPNSTAAHPPATATGIGANAQSPAYTSPLSTSDQLATRLAWRAKALGTKDLGMRLPNDAIISPVKPITTRVTVSPSI